MIVIDGDRQEPRATQGEGDLIPVQDLLAACAAEAGRIALAAEQLDISMGAMMAQFFGPSGGIAAQDAAVRGLAQELQAADRIRQELSGLARALDLVVGAPSMTALLPVTQVRSCTPLGQLQHRLLSHQSAGGPQRDEAN